jgi:hypothetical protein
VATSAFGAVVRNPNKSAVTSPSLIFRTDVHLAHIPAKQARGRTSSNANQIGCIDFSSYQHLGCWTPKGAESFLVVDGRLLVKADDVGLAFGQLP